MVTKTVDPLGGSYAIEAATDQLERAAVVLLDRIEAKGGVLEALQKAREQQLTRFIGITSHDAPAAAAARADQEHGDRAARRHLKNTAGAA